MRNAIEIHALTKRYGTLTALDEVSFEVGRGELFGLIGPDGAGKTTLSGCLRRSSHPTAAQPRSTGWISWPTTSASASG